MNQSTKTRILSYCREHLSPRRMEHVLAVSEEAKQLALRFGASPEAAELASLFHDCVRGWTVEELNRAVMELGLDPELLDSPHLSHSKIAAELMEREYGIMDPDLIDAVRFHTTGRKGMGLLEKVLYLADAIEPLRHYPGVDEIRRLAEYDLDQACLASMEHTIHYLNEKGQFIDQDTICAREDLAAQVRSKP